ncbi:MAG: phenylalanine--tRNA ligase subunit alpha [Proteobacteria bacterium]|nr:phenylalanine--tRNA ligase subunit alpha [Desulfobulbaceae bacterium]MBU4152234.1 phenylalanine--tRNA ligase subunit alpha [Pseudomonadota bacterium]
MEEELLCLKSEALESIDAVQACDGLESCRVKYLGRKGLFTSIMRSLSQVSEADRPRFGKLANEIKQQIEAAFSEKQSSFDSVSGASKSKAIILDDLTLPGRATPFCKHHPVTQVMSDICAIFERLGFTVAEGPDIELDFYNFEGLNIPEHHPARDMHDTFYISSNVLLRTHTSPMQVRTMEKQSPPLRMIAPGKVYRCDSDITHTPMFHQVEGFLVDRNVSFADLKGVLSTFISQVFSPDTAIRFRPSFFPFTEPSAEVDIACVICAGAGCRVCKQTGWLEILGAGLIDPEVFAKVGYDPEQYSGFAFGLGVERIAMLKYGITDIRLFYENDIRFLRQF